MAPAIHRAVAFVVLPAAPTYPSAYGVLVDLDPTRVRGAPTPRTPPLVAETLLRRTAQPVLARRCHPTGAWPITLRWILDIIDDHPGWPSGAAGGGRLAGRRWRPNACASRPPHPAALTGSGQRRHAERNQSENEKLGGLATRPRRLQLYTMTGRCAVTSSAEFAPDAPVVSDAAMVDTATTSFRNAHGLDEPCRTL